jgi:hypothetical protein
MYKKLDNKSGQLALSEIKAGLNNHFDLQIIDNQDLMLLMTRYSNDTNKIIGLNKIIYTELP